jgi:histidyl-tRNA synthetase
LLLLPGSAGPRGRLDVAVTVMGERYASRSFAFAAAARAAGLRASVYLGSSGKLGRQLKWAADTGARWALIYGASEDEAGTVTVRDMSTGDQAAVPAGQLTAHLSSVAGGAGPSGLAGPAVAGPGVAGPGVAGPPGVAGSAG